MRILLTGSEGFVGSAVKEKLCKVGGVEIINLDIKINNSDGDIRYCFKHPDIDMVIHCAGLTQVPDSIKDPKSFFETNVWGTYRIFDMYKGARLVNVASCISDPCVSPYGLSKKLGEAVTDYFPNSVNVKLFNLFGEGFKSHVVYEFAKKMLLNQDVEIVGDGTAKRDYVYIGDAVDTLLNLAFSEVTGLVDVGYGKLVSINELFKFMADYLLYTKPPKYVGERPCDQYITRARNVVTGVGFERGMRRTLDYYKRTINV
jgi:UDP-glucose 4-epimerase